MIKKLEVEDIAKILTLEDDKFTELFICEVGEWVQFLMQHVNNPNFFMIGAFENNQLLGYMIAVNTVIPPVVNGISAWYSKTAGIKNNKKELDEMIKWAKEKGAVSIDLITNNVIGHAAYGFRKKATLMTLKI